MQPKEDDEVLPLTDENEDVQNQIRKVLTEVSESELYFDS
jgi:hypothetical protein